MNDQLVDEAVILADCVDSLEVTGTVNFETPTAAD